ncbi:MAG TPA: DUF4290 domain-containing protein [Flavobacteriales bacterium]|nr:DUF4290 domain-containing protein [Flavobacteriales bacterium]
MEKKMFNHDYNTQRPHLFMPEHGRYIQEMVNHAMTIADREERNKAAKTIVQVMGILNPQPSGSEDFKQKLWTHLFLVSDFKLDVDSPYPMPEPATFATKPEKVKYPRKDVKYGHYGKTIELMVAKAVSLPDGEEKNAIILMVANLMKRMYLTWNRDSVTDDVILGHLKDMSGGKIDWKDVQLSTQNMGKPQGQGQSQGQSFKKKKFKKHNQNKKRF